MSKVNEIKIGTQIVVMNIVIFYILLQLFANKPGDWGKEKMSNRDSLYFILTTLSTVGYGDITPQSENAKSLVMFFHFTMLIELYTFLFKFKNNNN